MTAPVSIERSFLENAERAITLHIAKQVKVLRIVNGKTQTEFGKILGLTYQQVHKCESGFSKISLPQLWVLTRYFDVEFSYFFENFDNSILAQCGDGGLSSRSDDGMSSNRLILTVAKELQAIESPKILRALLGYMRAIADSTHDED